MSKTVVQLQAEVKAAEDNVRRLEKEVATLEGQINAAKDEMEREFQVDTVEAAEKLLVKYTAEVDKLTASRDALAQELEGILAGNDAQSPAKV